MKGGRGRFKERREKLTQIGCRPLRTQFASKRICLPNHLICAEVCYIGGTVRYGTGPNSKHTSRKVRRCRLQVASSVWLSKV